MASPDWLTIPTAQLGGGAGGEDARLPLRYHCKLPAVPASDVLGRPPMGLSGPGDGRRANVGSSIATASKDNNKNTPKNALAKALRALAEMPW